MPLTLRAMRYVQTAIRLGNISAAGEAMNVAPSAIATALGQAEETFGIALVTRARSKGIYPTSAGRDVLRRIDDLLERYDSMMTDVSDLQSGLSGTLTIGYNAPIAPAFLPAITAKLRETSPDFTLAFVDGDNSAVQEGLLNGNSDVILFVEELPNPQIETLPLIFAPTYCLCPKDHPIAQGKSVSMDRVLQEPLVLLDRPAARTYYMELLEKTGEDFNIVATTNSTEMARSLVAAGTGVSLLNMRPGNTPAYAEGATACVPLAEAAHGLTISIGTAPGPKRRLLQAFIEACVSYFDSPAGAKLIVPQQD